MSVAAPPTGAFPLPAFPLRRFSVDEYHRMIWAGIFTEDDPIELLEGWIVQKLPHNPTHDAVIDLAREVIQGRLPAGWRVRVQSAITTGDSEPEPDLAVVPGPASRYLDHHPGPQEIAALIEVSDSTLAGDRQDKGRLYARAAIGCYWIINLVDRRVEVYTDPSGPAADPGYRSRRDFGLADAVPLVIAGRDVGPILVRELLLSP